MTGKKGDKQRKPSTSRKPSRAVPTSPNIDDFSAELKYAGNRSDLVNRIDRLYKVLEQLGLDETDRRLVELGRGEKKNFAQRLSTAVAQKIADALRPDFPAILPNADGRGHESRSKGASGLKKIDVNYSLPRSGLELAISIKTINFKDEVTKRYTKNTKRVDGELRAEAEDVHTRQPFAVLAAYLFLPVDAATDGKASSLDHNAKTLVHRAGRVDTKNASSQIELAFIGLYSDDGHVAFYRPNMIPPHGVPSESMTFSQTLQEVRALHAKRNPRK